VSFEGGVVGALAARPVRLLVEDVDVVEEDLVVVVESRVVVVVVVAVVECAEEVVDDLEVVEDLDVGEPQGGSVHEGSLVVVAVPGRHWE
jgi:hypothetical protein